MFQRVLKFLLPIGLVLSAVLIAVLMIESRPGLPTSDSAVPLPRVQVTHVQLGDVPVAVRAHGTVVARHELDLVSEVTGRVVWVATEFQPGERIEAGQLLLRVDPVAYRLALAEAKADLSRAETALADAEAFKRKASIVEGKLNIEAARERITKAEQDLAYTEIRAPFNAVIDRQMVEPGQFINRGQVVAHLLSSDTAEVTLPISAAEAAFLDGKGSGQVVLSAQLGASQWQWAARVLRVESRVDRDTRVVPVVVSVESPYDNTVHKKTLPLGLFVEASIPGRPIPAAVRLPSSALQSDESVFVLEDGTLHRRAVVVAHRGGDTVVVSEGLESGDQVVITRLEVMFEGMRVVSVDA